MSKFKVHSAHATEVDVPAKMADGTEIVGKMPAILVELVGIDGGGTITHRERIATTEERDAALAKFAVGAEIEITLTQTAPPAPA